MLALLIIIAVLLLWVVRCLYQLASNQVAAQRRTETLLSQIVDRLDKLVK
jgi:uncharacterized membrane protein